MHVMFKSEKKWKNYVEFFPREFLREIFIFLPIRDIISFLFSSCVRTPVEDFCSKFNFTNNSRIFFGVNLVLIWFLIYFGFVRPFLIKMMLLISIIGNMKFESNSMNFLFKYYLSYKMQKSSSRDALMEELF